MTSNSDTSVSSGHTHSDNDEAQTNGKISVVGSTTNDVVGGGVAEAILAASVAAIAADNTVNKTTKDSGIVVTPNNDTIVNVAHNGTVVVPSRMQCLWCTKSFIERRNLQAHGRAKHPELFNILCAYCGERVIQEDGPTNPKEQGIKRRHHITSGACTMFHKKKKALAMFRTEFRARMVVPTDVEASKVACLWCGDEFATTGNLQNHCHRHHLDRAANCVYCGVRISDRSDNKKMLYDARQAHIRAQGCLMFVRKKAQLAEYLATRKRGKNEDEPTVEEPKPRVARPKKKRKSKQPASAKQEHTPPSGTHNALASSLRNAVSVEATTNNATKKVNSVRKRAHSSIQKSAKNGSHAKRSHTFVGPVVKRKVAMELAQQPEVAAVAMAASASTKVTEHRIAAHPQNITTTTTEVPTESAFVQRHVTKQVVPTPAVALTPQMP